jgi:hypothetical protein
MYFKRCFPHVVNLIAQAMIKELAMSGLGIASRDLIEAVRTMVNEVSTSLYLGQYFKHNFIDTQVIKATRSL